MAQGAMLVVPALGEGRGGGHLVRSLALVRSLRDRGREAWLYAGGDAAAGPGAGSGAELSPDHELVLSGEAEVSARPWDWIVLDQQKTSPASFARWSALAPLGIIGLDEGGPLRASFDFLVDLLPALPGAHPPNLLAPGLNPLPKNRRDPPFASPPSAEGREPNILVSFGAEDPAGLTVPAALALHRAGGGGAGLRITAIFGFLNRDGPGRETLCRAGVEVREAPPDFRELLAGYDLVITHFGLTAFECLAAGVPAVLLSPGPYHERLARAGGFLSFGTGKKAFRRFGRYFFRGDRFRGESLAGLNARCRDLAGRYHLSVPDLSVPDISVPDLPVSGTDLAAWEPLVFPGCPLCGGSGRTADPVVARFPERSYRRCKNCGTVYLNRRNPPPVEYSRDYFFSAYRKQYGKTYLEDFPSLKKTGHERLAIIRRILGPGPGTAGAGGAVPKPGAFFPPPAEKTGLSRVPLSLHPLLTEGTLRALPIPCAGEPLLDIGCAYGPFLAAAGEAGFAPRGVEPAGDAALWAARELGFPVERGFFPHPALKESPPGSFAVITLWYVIEHFRNLPEVLAEIFRLLRPGGVLAFSTPALGGISGRSSLKKFLAQSPGDHFTVWDSRRIRGILEAYGFGLKKIRVTGHHPERFPLIGKFLSKRRGAAYRLCLLLSRIFRLGDTFEAYAVKTALPAKGRKKENTR